MTLTFDLLTLKMVSESRVTWASSVPILVFLGLCVLHLGPMYATDVRHTSVVRQTDVRRKHCLLPRPLGRGIINRSAWLRLACQRAPLTCYVTVTLLTLVRLVEGRRTAVESNSNRSCKHSREYDDDGYVGVYIIAH